MCVMLGNRCVCVREMFRKKRVCVCDVRRKEVCVSVSDV